LLEFVSREYKKKTKRRKGKRSLKNSEKEKNRRSKRYFNEKREI